MGAVLMLAGLEIRSRWRSTIAIVLLVGAIGAVVLATTSGARRTATALDRFNQFSGTSDVEINVGQPSAQQLEEFGRSPGVAAVSRLRGYAIVPSGFQEDELALAAPVDDVFGRDVDRARLIAGREPDPGEPLEIAIGEGLAAQRDLAIGDGFDATTFTQDQIDRAFAGGDPGTPEGPSLQFAIVGVVRRPLDLGVREATGGVVVLSRSFAETYDGKIGAWTDVLRTSTDRGAADVPRVVATARRMFGDAPTFGAQGLGIETEGARSAIDVLTTALWIVAGIAALAGLVTIGIVLGRDVAAASHDQPTLFALGMTRRRRIAVSVPRALIVGGAGTVLAALGAWLLSPRFPIGIARRADPDVGFHADWTVLAIGLALLLATLVAIVVLAAARATRRVAIAPGQHPYRLSSSVVERAAALGLRPAATVGLRMAIHGGRGDRSVPVRSAFAGAVLGVAGITAALVFAASLTHLVDTPRLYGWTWDIHGEVPTRSPCRDATSYGVERDPAVDAVGVVCTTYDDVEVAGHPVTIWGFRSLHGSIGPEVVDGRAPRSAGEIALGAVTMRDVDKNIGDTVTVRGTSGRREYRIVGRVALPAMGEAQPLADGAAVTAAGFRPLYSAGENETHFLVARGEPGAGRTALEERFTRIEEIRNVGASTVSVEIDRLQQIDRIPIALAALLATLAVAAVAHALVVAVRRRRSDLAVLKVLGFTRGQVRATIAWQATILGGCGLALGIPLGIVLGRWSWQLVADGLGVRAEISSPAWWLLAAVGAALVVVNVVALLPARSAARTRPAVALRAG